MEDKHHNLFQSLWVNFNEDEYNRRIERYIYRLKINDLADGWLNGKQCIDCGCGHGNFAHALVQSGAKSVMGIDFGEESIEYAINARDRLSVDSNTINFGIESVYNLQSADESFDFALQNGVFHHLDDEDKAYNEVYRVLKKGGWFWVYTDGAGGISYDLWDASVHILREIPLEFVLKCLDELNLKTGKRYHMGDSLKATYRHHTWESITGKLTESGFGNFRRIVGGFDTDFDHDVIAADKYGEQKFGAGDIRFLAQKVR
jgi:ubiquinone/menaquinone biosynthesis C-methylase UbiE